MGRFISAALSAMLSCILTFAVCAQAAEKTFRVEVLQVTDIEPFEKSYQGFISALASGGLVQGNNLAVRRTVIGFDIERAGIWKKIGVLMRIRSEASRIAKEKPDLVLTIGTPATKYAKDTIVSAGVPLVFTAVAVPEAAGCASLTRAGPGFTGSTLHMDMTKALGRLRAAFPSARIIGMVHSDDENGIAHVEEAKRHCEALGFAVVSQEVDKNDSITGALERLKAQGVQVFCVPLDTYYGLRGYEACRALEVFSNRTHIPVASFALMKVPGAVIYVGSDFGRIGELSGSQALEILLNKKRPEDLPILMQDEPALLLDKSRARALGLEMPPEIIDRATIVDLSRERKYRIEVLQVTDIAPFQDAFDAFIRVLRENWLEEGVNLIIGRKIIDYDLEKAGLWDRLGVLMRIRSEAGRIADLRPDLVLTIGTPATKYARSTIVSAGIPLVFTAVAIPEAAGCPSLTEGGKGVTGSTLYMNIHHALKIVRLAFPEIKRAGLIHSDDENGLAHAEQVRLHGPRDVNITFITKEVSKNDHITPSAEELLRQGAQAFCVPLDTYYGLRNYEASKELREFSLKNHVPVFSLALVKIPGAMMYVGSDFGDVGSLAGSHALKILKESALPEELPILKQQGLRILVDTHQLEALGYRLPLEVLEIAEEVR
jgi:putative ABC transport system substrate-binding protein